MDGDLRYISILMDGCGAKVGGDISTDHGYISEIGMDVDGILFYLGTEICRWPVGDLMPARVQCGNTA